MPIRQNEFSSGLAPMSWPSPVVYGLHRRRRGHRFESCSLILLRFYLQLLKLLIKSLLFNFLSFSYFVIIWAIKKTKDWRPFNLYRFQKRPLTLHNLRFLPVKKRLLHSNLILQQQKQFSFSNNKTANIAKNFNMRGGL